MIVNGENCQTLNVKRYFKKETLNVKRSSKAQYLVDKFKSKGCKDADNCYYYFVKCFQTLPEDTIWSIYEAATTKKDVKSPIKYFIGACRNQMS